MKFRNLIFVLAIAFSIIFASMIGTSYAYYVATDGTSINVTTSDLDPGVAILFEQSQYINSYTGIPISDEDVLDLASASVFRIVPDTDVLTGSEVAVNIGLVDLHIDDNLVTDDFKYRLSCNDGTSDVITSDGSGSSFTEEVITNDYIVVSATFVAKKAGTHTINVENRELSISIEETINKENYHFKQKFFRSPSIVDIRACTAVEFSTCMPEKCTVTEGSTPSQFVRYGLTFPFSAAIMSSKIGGGLWICKEQKQCCRKSN